MFINSLFLDLLYDNFIPIVFIRNCETFNLISPLFNFSQF